MWYLTNFRSHRGTLSNKMDEENTRSYEKHHSFEDFYSSLGVSLELQRIRAIKLLKFELEKPELATRNKNVLQATLDDLQLTDCQHVKFKITQFIADEISKLADEKVAYYLYHRYRYDVFPTLKELDDYPPYIQIEPTSICNFRCIFCYQSDQTFSSKKSNAQGSMKPELFYSIVDEIHGNVEFGSLASRGEPLVSKDIKSMLLYAGQKMLGLKINTNASLLTEDKCHAILQSNISTVVFSADAADPVLYEKLRVNGKFDKVVANIEMFNKIRDAHYKGSRTISRVSGVFYDPDNQKLSDMINFWKLLVDQIAFVRYNPWESVYETKQNNIVVPCSDLWRRMFVWYDGAINPCDTDYKSTLKVGCFPETSLSSAWKGEAYMSLRNSHLNNQRISREPCSRCVVT